MVVTTGLEAVSLDVSLMVLAQDDLQNRALLERVVNRRSNATWYKPLTILHKEEGPRLIFHPFPLVPDREGSGPKAQLPFDHADVNR